MMDRFYRTAYGGGVEQTHGDGRPFPNPIPGNVLPDSGETVNILIPKSSTARMVLRQKRGWRNGGTGAPGLWVDVHQDVTVGAEEESPSATKFGQDQNNDGVQ